MPLHELDLRQYRPISSRTGATWFCLSRAILDADACRWCSNCSARDGLGSVSRPRLGTQLEGIAILERRFSGWPHWVMAGDDLGDNAHVTELAVHRTDVVQLCAIHSMPINGDTKQ